VEDADRDEEDEPDEEDSEQRSSVNQKQFREDQGESPKKKFHFKMSEGNNQASTVYGSKFNDFRKTFQNFNGQSNKAINIVS
jgi:hypothetical protein